MSSCSFFTAHCTHALTQTFLFDIHDCSAVVYSSCALCLGVVHLLELFDVSQKTTEYNTERDRGAFARPFLVEQEARSLKNYGELPENVSWPDLL